MKLKLLYLIKMVSKNVMYGLILQCLFLTTLMAHDIHAQIKPIDKTYVVLDKSEWQLQEIFKNIENITDYKFVYPEDILNNKPIINTKKKRQSVNDLLVEIGTAANLKFKQVDNSIYVGVRQDKKEENPQIIEEAIITGKVTDENGEPLPGASVTVAGTTTGTVTDMDGNYTITVPDGSTLIFSYIGFETMQISVDNRSQIDVSLNIDSTSLEEIVVTAFGIEKEKRQLVYATQEVAGKDLAAVGNSNLLNGLQGKVAGVTVNLNSGMPGKSPDIRIRGYRSLTGSNAPLYVIDGMPVAGGGRQIDFNPNDIESINILKGQAASALYGLRAANGVVVITTKSGKSANGKPTVTFSSHFNVDEASFLPDTQKEFAQGLNGVFDPNNIWTWGPRISGLGTYTNQRGEQEEAAAYDNQRDFYQRGRTINNNVTFANGSDIGNFLLGIGHTNQTGIVPNTDMTRINLKLNGELNLSKKFTVNASFNYSDLSVNDFPETFGNDNFFRGLIETPPSYNLRGKPFAEPDNPYRQIFYRASQNNPYWVINNNFRTEDTKRTFGNIFFKYNFTDNLSLNYRIGADHFSLSRTVHRELGDGPAGRANPPSAGSLALTNTFATQINSNFFLSYNKDLNENLTVDVIIGNEIFDNNSIGNNSTGSNYLVGGWPNLANTTLITAGNSQFRNRIVGFYGNANIGWKDMIFLNASVRNDIVSNMLSSNRSFIYPSVGTGIVLTEAIPAMQNAFSFAKVRATYAEVGQAGPLYVNDRGFNALSPSGFTFPFQGLGSWTQNTTRVSPDLVPENTKSFEVGFDFRFLNDRIGIDYTYYRNLSEGQIFSIPIPVSTGATSEVRNAGKLLSLGHEIMLSISIIESANVKWQFNTNFSTYTNRVESLYGDTDRVIITAGDGVSLVAEIGETYPAFLGTSFLRDPATNQKVIQSNPALNNFYGLPIRQTIPSILGTPNPDFEFNFINSLRYKNFNFSLQVDWRKGGLIFSQSLTESIRRGLAPETLEREEDVILEGVKGTLVDGELVLDGENDIVINKDFRWGNTMFGITENILTDASFVRLRELTLSYELPNNIFGNKFIQSASVMLTGRNLFLITKSFVDPELNTSEGFAQSSNTAGIEWSQIPQTKSYGIGINFRF